MLPQPPQWAHRFLLWFCNPHIVEEIEGDLLELFHQRVESKSVRSAKLNFIWDVFRFFRWSNIRRSTWFKNSAEFTFHVKLAWRDTASNPFQSLVRLAGIAISFGYAITLFLFAFDELSYDKNLPRAERLFRIGSRAYLKGNTTDYAVSPVPLARELKAQLPEVVGYTRYIADEYPLLKKDENFFSNLRVLIVDGNYKDLFPCEFIVGGDAGFNEPGKLLLSEQQALKIFGRTDPLGETVLYHTSTLLEVIGVFKTPSHKSHIKPDALISWATFSYDEDWNNLNAYSYILLSKSASNEEVSQLIMPVLKEYSELIADEYAARYEPIVQNVTEIHLAPPLDEDYANKGNKTLVYMLIAIGVLFSILGVVTYVNLASAKVTQASKRAGLLVIFCGSHSAFRQSVLTESFLTLTAAALLSILVVLGNLRFAECYLGRELHLPPFANAYIPLSFLGYFLFVCFVVYLSITFFLRIKAVHVLKGQLVSQKSVFPVRSFFVSLQFAFSMVMIALIVVLVQQFDYIQSKDHGFQDKNVMVLKLHPRSAANTDLLKTELMKYPAVQDVAGSSYYPEVIETKYVFNVETDNGMEKRLIPLIWCHPNYLNLIDVKFEAGRNLDNNSVSDRHSSYIINEAAARTFGWSNAVGKAIEGPLGPYDEGDRRGSVVGVVKDFNFRSLYNTVDPLIIITGDGFRYLYVKLEGNDIHTAIDKISGVYTRLFPEYPFEWEFLDSKCKSLYEQDYEVQLIIKIGSAISFIISCLGIFSISSLMASFRRKELGIRKVVGASLRQLVTLHIERFAGLFFVSLFVACPAIFLLSEYWLNSFAYRIELGLIHFLVPALLAALTIIIISGIHGFRFRNIQPVDVLRSE